MVLLTFYRCYVQTSVLHCKSTHRQKRHFVSTEELCGNHHLKSHCLKLWIMYQMHLIPIVHHFAFGSFLLFLIYTDSVFVNGISYSSNAPGDRCFGDSSCSNSTGPFYLPSVGESHNLGAEGFLPIERSTEKGNAPVLSDALTPADVFRTDNRTTIQHRTPTDSEISEEGSGTDVSDPTFEPSTSASADSEIRRVAEDTTITITTSEALPCTLPSVLTDPGWTLPFDEDFATSATSTEPSITATSAVAQAPVTENPERRKENAADRRVQIRKHDGLSTSYCSEFVKAPEERYGYPLRKRPNKHLESDDKDLWLLLECHDGTMMDDEAPGFGFRVRHVTCDAGQSIFLPNDDKMGSFVATDGKVKMLKSFIANQRAYVIAILSDKPSHLYEMRPSANFASPVYLVKVQDLPQRYATDVDVISLSTGEVFVTIAISHPDAHDKSKMAEKISPVYRFNNGRLSLCDNIPLTKAVAVRGWEDNDGVFSLVLASEVNQRTGASVLSFFEVITDEERLCRVVYKRRQSIGSIDHNPLCGVQSLEVMRLEHRVYLIVTTGNPTKCNSNSTRSFILPENTDFRSEKGGFQTRNAVFILSTIHHDKFRVVNQDCATILIGHGYRGDTEFFTVHESLHGLSLKKMGDLRGVRGIAGLSLGFCASQPFINLNPAEHLGGDGEATALTMQCPKFSKRDWSMT